MVQVADGPKLAADLKKQYSRVVQLSQSIAGLAGMIQQQAAKANALGPKGTEWKDADYKAFLKASEAVIKGRTAMFKEIQALSKEFDSLKVLEKHAEAAVKKGSR